MCLKAPKFWYQDSALSSLLSPLSGIYLAGHRLNQSFKTPYKSTLPVLCVGNIVTGGSGKTPTVLALVELLTKAGMTKNPVILTRGYGGNLKGPTYVSPGEHSYKDVGDEALLLARAAPTIVSADRAAGARLAELGEADLIIMDDGLQNNGLEKSCALLVIDSNIGFGNGKLLPAGPLREPVTDAMARVDAIISVGGGGKFDIPGFEANISATAPTGAKYVAFVGIGHPEKFRQTLESLGGDIAGWHAFADHYPYKQSDLSSLQKEAEEKNAILITTEKDHVRLPENIKGKIQTLPITMKITDAEKLTAFLREKLK